MLVSKSLSQHKIKYKLLAMKARDLNRKVKFLIDRIEDRYRQKPISHSRFLSSLIVNSQGILRDFGHVIREVRGPGLVR